jgi:LysR family transcriptional regulator, nod-box dependent transcriptional activator
MHFHKLDLNLLVAFDALVEERSVSRAADRLNLSQSALSSALSRLREYFDDELLVQVGRRMEPTALGLELAPSIREILHRIRVTIHTRPSFDPTTAERRFRIMTSDYLVEVLLADVLRELAHAAPGIQMQILSPNATAFALFLKGDIDLIITPEDLTVPDHPRSTLFEDSYSCLVWSENTAISEPLTLEQYLAMRHVVVHVGFDQPSILERWLTQNIANAGAGERRIDVITPSFGVVPHLVIGTQRIATMHTRHARVYEKLLPLRLLPPPPGFPIMREMMQWHRHLDTDPSLRWLTDFLQRAAATAPPTHAQG